MDVPFHRQPVKTSLITQVARSSSVEWERYDRDLLRYATERRVRATRPRGELLAVRAFLHDLRQWRIKDAVLEGKTYTPQRDMTI